MRAWLQPEVGGPPRYAILRWPSDSRCCVAAMPCGEVGRADTRHVGLRDVQRIDHDQGQPGPRESGEIRGGQVAGDADGRAPVRRGQVPDPLCCPARTACLRPGRARTQHDVDLSRLARLEHSLDDLDRVAVHDALEEQFERGPLDRLRPAPDVLVLPEDLLHPRAGGLGDVAAPVEHLGDSRDRHARGARDRGQGDAASQGRHLLTLLLRLWRPRR